MAKIILATENILLREIALAKERMSIGRGPNNDIIIDDFAISAEHAVIVTVKADSFLEDLNSTNGTQVNGQPVKKHFLQDGDVAKLARYRIQYVTTENCAKERTEEGAAASGVFDSMQNRKGHASIRILNGANAGKEIALTKAFTTVGHPGDHVVSIARHTENYYLTHVEGRSCTLLNGNRIGGKAVKMESGDVMNLAGTQISIWIPPSILSEAKSEA